MAEDNQNPIQTDVAQNAQSQNLLVPLDKYLSSGIHIGMKQKTKDMSRFIYKFRPDGLAVLDVQTIDKRLALAAKMISRFRNVLVVSRKSNARKAIRLFGEITSINIIEGRMLPGTLTNPDFKRFMEPDLIVITDPLADAQAMKESIKMRIPIISLADTFNETRNIDFVIPANNKGRKSLALIYWILAKEVAKLKGIINNDEEMKYQLKDFMEAKGADEERDMHEELMGPKNRRDRDSRDSRGGRDRDSRGSSSSRGGGRRY